MRPLQDKDAFLFYYNASDETQYVLGNILPFNMSKHPIIQEMYSSGKAPG